MKKGIWIISSSVTEFFRIQTDKKKKDLKHNLGHFCLSICKKNHRYIH